MTEVGQIQLGAEIFRRGGSYKDCKNKYTLKGYSSEERNSRSGYSYQKWNKMGQGLFQGRMKTVRNEDIKGFAWKCDNV